MACLPLQRVQGPRAVVEEKRGREGGKEAHCNIVQQFGCEIESALLPQIALAPAKCLLSVSACPYCCSAYRII